MTHPNPKTHTNARETSLSSHIFVIKWFLLRHHNCQYKWFIMREIAKIGKKSMWNKNKIKQNKNNNEIGGCDFCFTAKIKWLNFRMVVLRKLKCTNLDRNMRQMVA